MVTGEFGGGGALVSHRTVRRAIRSDPLCEMVDGCSVCWLPLVWNQLHRLCFCGLILFITTVVCLSSVDDAIDSTTLY